MFSALRRPVVAVALAAAILSMPDASAAEPEPRNYVAALASTTVVFRPADAAWEGHQADVAPAVGFGRLVSPRLALELDLGPAFVRGTYAGFGVTPGAVWSLNPRFYLAGRALVTVHPERSVVLLPGAGLLHEIGATQLFGEANLAFKAAGAQDRGLSLTLGLIRTF